MPNNVLFKKVSTIDEVSNCNNSDIVFCESTGEIYTHSTRYGAPTISEIGDENPNGDITMSDSAQVSTVAMKSSKPSHSNNDIEPLTLNIVPQDYVPEAKAGYIRYEGNSYPIEEFDKFDIKEGRVIDGIHLDSSTIVEMKDLGIYEWGISNVDVMSNKYSSLSEAMKDMDGVRNSNILTSYKSNLFDNVSNGWYIPSLGELNELHEVLDVVQKSLEKYGTKLMTSYYWSSTSGTNNLSAWAYEMSSGTGQLGYRTSKLAVRRFKKI